MIEVVHVRGTSRQTVVKVTKIKENSNLNQNSKNESSETISKFQFFIIQQIDSAVTRQTTVWQREINGNKKFNQALGI